MWKNSDGDGILFDVDNYPVGVIHHHTEIRWILNNKGRLTEGEVSHFVSMIQEACRDWHTPSHGRWQSYDTQVRL